MSTTHRAGPAGRVRRLLAATAAALLLAGCGTVGNTADDVAGAGGPTDGGDITFLIDTLGTTWVPNNSSISSFEGHIWGHLTDKLVYVDEQGEVSPWVAQSWEQNDDATEFTLHLRDGVTFSDGSPLDAEAVVANLDIWANGRPKDGINPIGLFPKTYDHAEAVDPTTVEVFFTAPTLGFIPTLGYHGSILISPTTLATPATEQSDLAKTVASGPFTVESWKEGDHVTLVKRPDYDWGPEALGHTGAAYLDSITYKQVPEQSLRVSSVQSGQADVAYNPSPQELGDLKAEGFTVAAPRYLGFVDGFALNTRAEPFDDVRVRQALQASIDRQQIIDTVYTPDWQLATSVLQSNVPGATDHSELLTHDPDRAAKLLDEAGWVTGADGIRAKDGKQLALTLYPNPYVATTKSIDELIAQQLGTLGWKVDIQSFDVVTYSERVQQGQTQAYEVSRSFIDAGTVAGILTDANNGEDWFRLGESDQTINELRDGIAAASSTEERDPLLDELQQYVLEQGLFVPRTQQVQRLYVQNPQLKGETYNGVAYANYYTAYLEK